MGDQRAQVVPVAGGQGAGSRRCSAARIPTRTSTAQFSLILVPTDTPGYDIERTVATMGHTGGHHCEVRYRDVRVPEGEHRSGDRGDGLRDRPEPPRPGPDHPLHALARPGPARVRADVRPRAMSRYAHGSLLSEKGEVQRYIAESAAEIHAARLMTLDAARAIDDGEDARVRDLAHQVLRRPDAARRDRPRHPGARRTRRHRRHAAGAHVSRGAVRARSTTGRTKCTAWSSHAACSATIATERPGRELTGEGAVPCQDACDPACCTARARPRAAPSSPTPAFAEADRRGPLRPCVSPQGAGRRRGTPALPHSRARGAEDAGGGRARGRLNAMSARWFDRSIASRSSTCTNFVGDSSRTRPVVRLDTAARSTSPCCAPPSTTSSRRSAPRRPTTSTRSGKSTGATASSTRRSSRPPTTAGWPRCCPARRRPVGLPGVPAVRPGTARAFEPVPPIDGRRDRGRRSASSGAAHGRTHRRGPRCAPRRVSTPGRRSTSCSALSASRLQRPVRRCATPGRPSTGRAAAACRACRCRGGGAHPRSRRARALVVREVRRGRSRSARVRVRSAVTHPGNFDDRLDDLTQIVVGYADHR